MTIQIPAVLDLLWAVDIGVLVLRGIFLDIIKDARTKATVNIICFVLVETGLISIMVILLL